MELKTKRGVEAILFKKVGASRYFLILHRILNWKGWESAKGGVDEGETPEQAVLREVAEETGLQQVKIVGTLPEKKEWKTKDTHYLYDVFLVEADTDEHVRLGAGNHEIAEHDDFKWLTASQALETLTYDNSKQSFKRALEEIKKQGLP